MQSVLWTQLADHAKPTFIVAEFDLGGAMPSRDIRRKMRRNSYGLKLSRLVLPFELAFALQVSFPMFVPSRNSLSGKTRETFKR